MQIEGFIFQLFSLFFGGAFIHYALAKLFGPLYFGRGFCGWACWNAMIFDLLPWKKSKGRVPYLGLLRYLHLAIVVVAVTVLFFKCNYSVKTGTIASLEWFLAGNALYFTTGIFLAFMLSDNRSFCKYICPIPPVQKVLSRFSILKVRIDPRKCTECHACEKNCPMDIKILEYKKNKTRIKSTECIMCNACSDSCPTGAIFISSGFDTCTEEHHNLRNTLKGQLTVNTREITTTGSKIVYKNHWMQVREDSIVRADGKQGIYGIVEKPDYALIVPQIGNNLVLVEQYRYPVQARFWEFPQGSWENESIEPIELAKAELREETGYSAKIIHHLGFIYQAYGYSSQGYNVFHATDMEECQQQLDPEELGLIAKQFSINEVENMIIEGRIKDNATIAAFGLLRLKRVI